MNDALALKEERLKNLLRGYQSLAVAYSGGVDSSYLADIAHEVLGARASMLLADSPSVPRAEVEEATTLANSRAWNFHIIKTTEFENEAYLKNDGTRCYYCRGELFQQMQKYAGDNQLAVMAYGAIMDDLLDATRVGAKAAQEQSVVAPLQAVGLAKAEIRTLSKRRNLPTWDKASFACLSSRFPTGTRVNLEDIQKVESAEEILKAEGFHQYRARHHGDICRIELDPSEIHLLLEPDRRARVTKAIQKAGYRHVALDLLGYTSAGVVTS